MPPVPASPNPTLSDVSQLTEAHSVTPSSATRYEDWQTALEPSLKFSALSDQTRTFLSTNMTPANSMNAIYRVPGTNVTLRIAISVRPIRKADIARTILETQLQLREFINMYSASDRLLNPTEDPFESSEEWTGCFFGVASYTIDRSRHLTYGMVQASLQGIWTYMYRRGNFFEAIFEVFDDTWGLAGVGRLSLYRPGLIRTPVVGRSETQGAKGGAMILPRARGGLQLTPRSKNITEKNEPILYRVPNTSILIAMIPVIEIIAKSALGRAILEQQRKIRNFIEQHDASDMALWGFKDPYESPPELSGCFIGVTMWPRDYDRLTCGMVLNLLQGLWEYLYRGERFHGVIFEVIDDTWGIVGVGKVSLTRFAPGGLLNELGAGEDNHTF